MHMVYGITKQPDLSRFGKSRIGRKNLRNAIDAFLQAERRASGRPALSGPPYYVKGKRMFHSIVSAVRGGVRSGASRRRAAIGRWSEVRRLRLLGYTQASIALLTHYSTRHVRRILSYDDVPLLERWERAKARLAERLGGGGHEHRFQPTDVVRYVVVRRVWAFSECRCCRRVERQTRASRCSCGGTMVQRTIRALIEHPDFSLAHGAR